ncbi:MAG: cytochrome-c peroxidase [Patescibacteria group bacterium]|nr:cytochrome-c peroxidase [Patescibacteria group bacterium]
MRSAIFAIVLFIADSVLAETPAEHLGRQLFFDPRLSIDGSTSCASCHDPARGFADGRQVAVGLIRNGVGKIGIRNTPTVLIAFKKPLQFLDGRSPTLESQCLGPIANNVEMGQQTVGQVMQRLISIPGYRAEFISVFRRELNQTDFGVAMAAFERTLDVGASPLDRFLAGDDSAISESARRGLVVATESGCFACHKPANDFRDGLFHNTGVATRSRAVNPDRGRAKIAPSEASSVRAFATPSWSTAASTAPYMHNGSLSTLRDVVEHYNAGGRFIRDGQVQVDTALDPRIKPLNLSEREKQDLVAMLESCQGTMPEVERPVLP